MKKIIASIMAIIAVLVSMAQVPQKMSYQAVIRNSSNQLITNQNVGIKISILNGSPNGTVVYTEFHTTPTNENGLVSIAIGGGIGFDAIDWANGPFYIKTETDPNGGSAFSISAGCQLLSVPYAMFAEQSGSTHISGNEAVFENWDKNQHDDVTLSDAQTITGSKTFASMIHARGLALPYTFGPDTAYVGSEGAFIGFGHEGHSEDFIGYKNNRFYFKDSPEGGDNKDPDVIVGGNIGIGIDEPWERLEVDGQVNMHEHNIINLADPVNEQDAATKAYVDASGVQSETDPVFSESLAAGIETQDLDRWNQAHDWGNHSAEGYLTSESDPAMSANFDFSSAQTGDLLRFNGARWVKFTPDYLLMETDPVFNVSAAAGIDNANINQWTTAYSWGNHASQGYFTSESDPTWNGTANQSTNIGREGNVGIGTTNPTQKLDVNGQVRIRGGNPDEGKVLTSDASGLARWESSSTATGIDGKGAINYIPRFTGEKTLGSSSIYQSGYSIGIGGSPSEMDTKFCVHHQFQPTINPQFPMYNPTYLAFFQTSMLLNWDLRTTDIAYIKADGEAWFKGPLKVGDNATASGKYSIALGNNTTAVSGNEIVVGSWNTLYIAAQANGWSASDRLFVIGNGTSESSRKNALTVLKNGNVGIGTSNPTYLLSVNGTIRAKKLIVETGWSDFVFEDDYQLMPLKELEEFILKNKHLPEIPSAKEVEENGISVGEISASLLQKIEELTLHIIRQQKQIEELARQNQQLNCSLDAITKK